MFLAEVPELHSLCLEVFSGQSLLHRRARLQSSFLAETNARFLRFTGRKSTLSRNSGMDLSLFMDPSFKLSLGFSVMSYSNPRAETQRTSTGCFVC